MNKVIFFLITFGLFQSLKGQDTLSIPTENIEVVKRFEAAISQATQKQIKVTAEPRETKNIKYSYNVSTDKLIDFDRPDPIIQALAYKHQTKTAPDFKDGYIYGSYGNFKTINAGAAYHYYIEDWLEGGFKVDHFQVSDTVPNSYRALRNSLVDFYLGYHLGQKTKVKLELNAANNQYAIPNFVGDTMTNLGMNSFAPVISFEHNNFEENGFATRFKLGYRNSKFDFDNFKEEILFSQVNFYKAFSNQFNFELPANFEYYLSNIFDENIVTFDLQPRFTWINSNYTLELGVDYTHSKDSKFLFPLMELNLDQLIPIVDLSLYARTENNYNSFYNLYANNPYYLTRETPYTPYFGAQFGFQVAYNYNDFSLGLNASYDKHYNQIIFSDGLPFGRFNVTQVNRDAIKLHPSVTYAPNDNVSIGLDYTYDFFLTDSLNLYYIPKGVLSFSGEFEFFDDRLILKPSIKSLSSRDFLRASEEESLDAFFDLALRVDFLINDSFSLFAKANNLLGEEYHLWFPQEVFRQQVWAGLKLRI